MSDLPAAQRQALEAWAEQAIDAGWLHSDATQSLADTTISAPGDLFEHATRPLVAGLFGGTGVGKSTLLNRLADEPVARTSAERPTSRNITLYVHRSVSVDKLPDSFPMQSMRTSLHNNDQYQHVLFIDMPDFDSVESANRALVDLWLPHLDVVLYVVSPERYRDDQGWRLLLKHAREHAWLFVMNHWDRAETAQLDDFRAQLRGAGLDDPMIFRTDSSARTPSDQTKPADDFTLLCTTLKTLSEQSIVENLQEHGILARLKALKSVGDTWIESLDNTAALQELTTHWQTHWKNNTQDLSDSMQWKFTEEAQRYAQPTGFWLNLFKRNANPEEPIWQSGPLIDEALLGRLDNVLEDYLNQQAQRHGLALTALKQAVREPYASSRQRVGERVDAALQRSLAMPGAAWHRSLYSVLGWFCVLLPLAALAWIAWRVVEGFVSGASDPGAYLSSNFAINGAMLLGLSWLIPAFAHHKLKPSRERAAIRGLIQGLDDALEHIEQQVSTALGKLGDQAITLRTEYQELWESLPADQSAILPAPLQRLLTVDGLESVQRSLDVRANTHNSTDSAPVS